MASDIPKSDAAPISAEALETGRKLFRAETRFLLGAAEEHQIPDTTLPEVAFAGRSNVGKSSLINALLGQKAMARTSSTPGRTREVNFFDVGGRLMVADLPGYGYARAPKTEQARWTRLIEDYLKGRQPLARLLILVDARHGLKESDESLMADLDTIGLGYQIVLTKADKVKDGPLARLQAELGETLARHPAAHPTIIATSARTGHGMESLRAHLAMLAEGADPS